MVRSRSSRGLAERALVRLALMVGDHADALTVIGGLNADLLTSAPDSAPHQGTLDVDLLLRISLLIDRDQDDFAWLERGLRAAGFVPSRPDRAWQWEVAVDGVPVRIDVLCDVPDKRDQEIALPGSSEVTAKNVEGPAPAQHDIVVRELHVDDLDLAGLELSGAPVASLSLRFAGLGGYLHAKAAAILGRREDRDRYDLAFVLLHNRAGGPAAAARAAFDALPSEAFSDHAAVFRAALRTLTNIDTDGPWVYAAQRIADGEGDGDGDAQARIAQDAVTAARLCLSAFDRLTAGSQEA